MIEVFSEVVKAALCWVLVTVSAHVLHLLAGCLSVGPREVSRQLETVYDGITGYLVFVLSAHWIKSGVKDSGGSA